MKSNNNTKKNKFINEVMAKTRKRKGKTNRMWSLLRQRTEGRNYWRIKCILRGERGQLINVTLDLML